MKYNSNATNNTIILNLKTVTIMKKFFTLIAAALLSSGAFAQSEWQNMITNGDMEGEQDPMWSSFWCHDYRQNVEFAEGSGQQYDESGQFQGFAEIIDDPLEPGNHCARVIARSEAEADEAGNKVAADGKLASWDCQFFVYATETIPEGKEIRMTMRVRADKNGHFETQAHWNPGNYNHYQIFGNIDVTPEWQKIQVSATVSADMTQEAAEKFFQSVAFNLSTDATGNVFYFDDVKLEIRDPKGPEEFTGWFNMLRHGTQSADAIGSYTNFTGRDAADGSDVKARIVNDPVDGQPALTVSAAAWEGSRQEQVFEEDGVTPVLDDEGNPTFKEVQYWHKADGTEKTTIDDWEAQFFVTVPHKFIPNSKYRLVMWYRADEPADIDTQLHNMPGSYVHWQAIGTLNCTPEWQKIEVEQDMMAEGKGCQTIAFNCNKMKDKPNNYYFRFEEFSFNAADVSDDERLLGSETVQLPVPEPGNDNGATGKIDFTNCLKTLEATSFENLVNENMGVANGVEGGVDTYASADVTAGFFLDDNGWFAEDGKISFDFGEVKDSDTGLNVTVYNDGESFNGKRLDTKFRYEYNNWFYLFNVSLIAEQIYNGIYDTVKATVNKTNSIYDLQGRRVEKATKGLYIMNGKKYMVK